MLLGRGICETMDSSGYGNRPSGIPESDFEGKLIDVRHTLTHEVAAPVFIKKCR